MAIGEGTGDQQDPSSPGRSSPDRISSTATQAP